MAIEITVPRLGWSMDEGQFVRWLKAEGESVTVGEPLFELENEKAVQPVESLDEGVLQIPRDGPLPGATVAVGQRIGWLLSPEEAARGDGQAWPLGANPDGIRAAEAAVATQSLSGSRAAPPVASQPRPGRLAARERRSATPRARRLAHQLGVDWSALAGTGRNGRVRERDVRARAAGSGELAGSVQPLSRRTIAARLVEGLQAMAPVTLTTRADAANLTALRRQFQTADAGEVVVPSISDILLKLTALALVSHPQLNARWDSGAVVLWPEIHLGLAVDTDAGLLVPVLRNPLQLGLREIARQTRQLIARARQRQLAAADLSGATFTITNLGPWGVDAFTPIISPPQAAILGVGAIRREPVIDSRGQLTPGVRMTLSLTFDHRVLDGVPAARFLQSLVNAIENPGAWLV